MSPLSGGAAILTPVNDPFAALPVLTGSSCFSDRNIWDFLSAEAAVASILLFSSKVNAH